MYYVAAYSSPNNLISERVRVNAINGRTLKCNKLARAKTRDADGGRLKGQER